MDVPQSSITKCGYLAVTRPRITGRTPLPFSHFQALSATLNASPILTRCLHLSISSRKIAPIKASSVLLLFLIVIASYLSTSVVPQPLHRTQHRVTICRHHRRPGLRPWPLQDVVLDRCPTAPLLCYFYVICLTRYNPSLFALLNVNFTYKYLASLSCKCYTFKKQRRLLSWIKSQILTIVYYAT